MHRLLKKHSPAMVVACLALFLAATGTGVAVVSSLPAGSVGTPQLKKNAVISIKVKDRSLKAVDFAKGQLPRGARGATGATGPGGAAGQGGAAGAAGAAGATHVVKRYAYGTELSGVSLATASCNAGEVATGVGTDIGGITGGAQPVVASSAPTPYAVNNGTPTGWTGSVRNISSGTVTALVWVICASP